MTLAMDYLEQLNQQQQEAVEHLEGPLLILAGAGSGKTRIITYRVMHLVNLGVPPEAILGVTFTNKAAAEMKDRIQTLTNSRVWISTFHSLGLRMLRESAHVLGYPGSFTIYDEEDSLRLIKGCMKELNISDKTKPTAFKGLISKAKNALQEPHNLKIALYQGSGAERSFPQLYALYQSKLREYQAVDFDDLLMLPVKILHEHPEVKAAYQNRWRFFLVDEYQDTNHAQYALIKALAEKEQNICVVGDPDQSIYSWRGAEITNILDFETDYPGAKVIQLEQNYRSTNTILKAANALIAQNYNRYDKQLWSELGDGEKITYFQARTEREESQYVVEQIAQQRISSNTPLNEMVVFYRTNFQSRQFEDTLLREGIPYVIVGGISFYQRKEIKDVLSFLRVVHSPADYVSFARSVHLPKRGVGEASLKKLQNGADEARVPIIDYIRQEGVVGGRQKKGINDYLETIDHLKKTYAEEGLVPLVQAAIHDTGYIDIIKADKETFEDRKENLLELVAKAMEWEDETLEGFLNELTLKTTLDESAKDDERISLMTLHNGKGLEFDTVFIAGFEDGLLPHFNSKNDEQAFEEERRLCYVGVTRAKKKLFLTRSRKRMIWGTTRSMHESPFLDDIPTDSFVSNPRRTASSTSFGRELDSYESDEQVRVHHPNFGYGVITNSYEGSLGLTYEIVFKGTQESKTIVAKYADLTFLPTAAP